MQPASISYPQKIQGRELNRKERPKGVLRVNASGTSATSEIANVNLDAGEAVIRVSDFNFAKLKLFMDTTIFTTVSLAVLLSAAGLLFPASTANAVLSQQAGAHAKPAPSEGGFTRRKEKRRL